MKFLVLYAYTVTLCLRNFNSCELIFFSLRFTGQKKAQQFAGPLEAGIVTA